MRMTHRPGCLSKPYLIKLRTTDVIVVPVQLGLEADRKVTLRSRQSVISTWPNIVDARNTIDRLALQERICIGNCLQDAWACERAIREIQFRSQQVTRQTANGIIGLGTAAIHGIEHCCRLLERTYTVVAETYWQERRCLSFMILPIAWRECTDRGSRCRCPCGCRR